MRVEIARTFRFEAARSLPRLPATHPCARVHGHGFTVEVVLAGDVDPAVGWLCDYEAITAAFEPLRKLLDHAYLNEVAGLENPTSEHIAGWIFDRLSGALPGLVAVSVCETPETRATYRGPPRGEGGAG